jgi:hypothetical protein
MDPAHILTATSPEALLSVLSYERRLLEQLLFRTTELAMLIEAGEHRFVQRALEEAQEVEDELGAAEVLRAAVLENLLPDDTEPTIEDVISRSPEAHRPALAGLAKDLRRLHAGIEEQREAGHAAAGRRAEVAARAQAGANASGYRSDGSAVVGA